RPTHRRRLCTSLIPLNHQTRRQGEGETRSFRSPKLRNRATRGERPRSMRDKETRRHGEEITHCSLSPGLLVFFARALRPRHLTISIESSLSLACYGAPRRGQFQNLSPEFDANSNSVGPGNGITGWRPWVEALVVGSCFEMGIAQFLGVVN